MARFTNTRLSGLKTLDSIYSGSRTLSDSNAFRSPFLYQDLYARIENTLQEKRSILFDLSQPDVMTNDELRTILEKRLNETNETLSKFIRQFVEFGDPPAEFEAAAQVLQKSIMAESMLPMPQDQEHPQSGNVDPRTYENISRADTVTLNPRKLFGILLTSAKRRGRQLFDPKH